MRRVLVILMLLIPVILSCSKQSDSLPIAQDHMGEFVVCSMVNATDNTKTTISDNALNWSVGDRIGVFCDGRQYNKCFLFDGGKSFKGYFETKGSQYYSDSVSYYAYYPYIYNGIRHNTELMSTLSCIQNAPFDSRYDFVVSNPVCAKYDESNMPILSFEMSNHLFGIIKISFVNDDIQYENQLLSELTIRAEGKVLSGGFSFNVSDPLSEPEFSSSIAEVSDMVTIRWTDEVLLGNGVKHDVYVIVNEFSATPISVSIKTMDYVFNISSNQPLAVERGEVVVLPIIDIGVISVESRIKKTLAYWGDSIATTTLTDYLQWLLGDDWNVICCGASGDTPLEVAGRNGCIPMRIKNAFVLPGNHAERVAIGNQLYSDWNQYGIYNPGELGVGNKSWFNAGTTSRLNNCQVFGIDCLMTRDDVGMYYLQRINDGPSLTIPALTEVKSYASLFLRDVDLLVTYMGTNSYGRRNGAYYDETIAAIYKEMTKFMEHTDDYDPLKKHNHIVVGFHHRIVSDKVWWSQEYHDYFLSQFGDAFLDLRTYGNANAERLLVQTGVVNSPSMISTLDHYLIAQGDWPASWQTDYETNVHPNSYGSKAIAIMVYEKMKELGYLN